VEHGPDASQRGTAASERSPEASDPGPAASERGPQASRWALFALLALVVVALDQLTKAWVVGRLAPGESWDVAGDLLRIVHGQNTGGLFGLFHGQATVFALASLVVVALIVGYEWYAGRSLLMTVALGLLLGGALGNLTDRLRIGYVVDFVDAGIGGLRWYTFNVADAAISTAIVLLVAVAVLGDRLGRDERGSGANERAAASR
jgi:signal peptidase II